METEYDPIPTRASLLKRLKDWGDHEHWKQFCDTYWSLVYGAAVRAGLSHCEAEEVVQETLVTVAKDMPNFNYDPTKGSFRTRLMRLTQWRITDQFRKRQRVLRLRAADRQTGTGTALIEKVPDPAGLNLEHIWDEEWHNNVLQAALRRIKKKADARQYQIFDCHVVKKWPIARVVRGLRVNRAKIYFARHRIGKLVKQEIAWIKQEQENSR